jgi:large subunit ribosomal protein L1
MAKDKSKDEIKADIVDEEISNVTAEEVKETDPKAKESIEKAEEPTAKAGKRSAKAQKEAEEKQAKEERKAEGAAEVEKAKPKAQQKPARPKAERKGKKYQENLKNVDKEKDYTLKEAMGLACKTSSVKFDASVELHVRLNVDPKQADQNVRDSVVLPAGTGKTLRVAVLADDDLAKKAKTAGAKIAGSDEIFKALDNNQIDFDVLIAVPELMQKLSKYARILGPKGLMPNPKSGTVTKDIEKAVKESLGGKVEYRVDSTGIVHLSIGKVSFGDEKLTSNGQAVFESIKSKKPASLKGVYVRSVFASSTMGPSIKINPADVV